MSEGSAQKRKDSRFDDTRKQLTKGGTRVAAARLAQHVLLDDRRLQQTGSPPGCHRAPGGWQSHPARTSKVHHKSSTIYFLLQAWSIASADRPVFRQKQATVGWTRLPSWLWKWGSAESLNLNAIHSVNDIRCWQRQKLRPIVCGREKTVTAFWWNPHIGEVIVVLAFREEPTIEILSAHADHRPMSSLIATLSALNLWSQGRTPHSRTSPLFSSSRSPPSESPHPSPQSSWLRRLMLLS